jgi:hypothetical protein
MTKISIAFPTTRSAIYKAIQLIIASGPRTTERLLAEIDFGAHGTQRPKIREAIQAGWIYETTAGTIDVTESTREHFAEPEPTEKYIGQITPAQYRPSVFASPGISKKNIPNRRGPRADALAIYDENPTFHRG